MVEEIKTIKVRKPVYDRLDKDRQELSNDTGLDYTFNATIKDYQKKIDKFEDDD